MFAATLVRTQHGDILVQDVGGKLTLGSANLEESAFEIGTRLFTSEMASGLTTDEPGWNALPGGSPLLPAGADGLPGAADLAWDILPMTNASGVSTLLYWNGDEQAATGVDFTPIAAGAASLSLFGVDGQSAAADGGTAIVPGAVIDRTDADGTLHRHRFFFLDDGDGSPTTQPYAGIYRYRSCSVGFRARTWSGMLEQSGDDRWPIAISYTDSNDSVRRIGTTRDKIVP